MSDELNVNGYICASNKVYDSLKSENISKDNLAKLDKNSDNKISEDELVEFDDKEEESASKKTYSDNPQIASLELQYEKEQEDIVKYQKRIADLMVLKNKTRVNVASASKNETKEALMSKLDNIQGEIDEYNTKIISSLNNMGTISANIKNIQTQIENTKTSYTAIQANSNASTASTSTNAVSNTASASLNVQTGTGQELMNVTGDLSICLDRVAESLNTSRQGAADYITTLCNTITNGEINPKVILSQIFSESSGIQSCSTTATSKFVGLGQMSAVAVEEINRQFGTNFTFSDMDNAAKNLEAMVYLMTYQYRRYDNNIAAAITAYNVGHYSGTVNNYAKKILSRV